MSRLKSLGALVVAPLTCLLVLACDSGQESSLTAPSPSFTVVGNPVVASASGSGQFVATGVGRTFSFTATRRYDMSVQGRFQVNDHAGGRIRGSVTCITVEGDGKTARIGGVVTNSNVGLAPVGAETALIVVDNSEGPQSPLDQITLIGFGGAGVAAFHCATGFDPSQLGDLNDITRGNIQVDQGLVVQSVTGSGSFILMGNNRTFSFTASRHADGTVSGQWERVNHVNESQTKSHGQVTCFTIFGGNQARLGGFATSGLLSTPPNNEVAWRVADNSEGANSPPDQISAQFVGQPPGTAGQYCAGAFGNTPGLNPVAAGNIQVGG